jgi:N4-gp56 family major capsid protein
MATGYFTPTTHAVMIPETWRKEAILELYAAMVMRDLIIELPVPEGTDTLHFPNIAKLAAEAITPGTPLVGKVNTETQTNMSINQYYGVPVTITKILMKQVQQNINILDLYRKRMAEALAYQIDQALLGLYSGLSQVIDNSLTDIDAAAIREARRYLNKANAPQTDRYLVISPEQEEAMLAIADFIDASKYGSAMPIQEGVIGKVYGFWVVVTDAVITATTRKNLAFHRDFAAIGIQQDIEIETGPYMPLNQAWDMVGSDIYGFTEMRDDFAVVILTQN